MGSGWEIDTRTEKYKKPCACGAGFLITYELELSSTKPPFRVERDSETTLECKNKDCPSRIKCQS